MGKMNLKINREETCSMTKGKVSEVFPAGISLSPKEKVLDIIEPSLNSPSFYIFYFVALYFLIRGLYIPALIAVVLPSVMSKQFKYWITDKRIILSAKGLFGSSVNEVSYTQITKAYLRKGIGTMLWVETKKGILGSVLGARTLFGVPDPQKTLDMIMKCMEKKK